MASPMAAGTRRLTKSHGDGINQFKFDVSVADSTEVKAGSMVMLDSSGKALPAAGTGGQVVLGRADFQAGSEDVVLDPPAALRVTTGVFSWDIDSTSLDNTKIGEVAY